MKIQAESQARLVAGFHSMAVPCHRANSASRRGSDDAQLLFLNELERDWSPYCWIGPGARRIASKGEEYRLFHTGCGCRFGSSFLIHFQAQKARSRSLSGKTHPLVDVSFAQNI